MRSKLMVSPEAQWLSVPPHWANMTTVSNISFWWWEETHKTRGEHVNSNEGAGDSNTRLFLLRGCSPNRCDTMLLYLAHKSFSLMPSHKFFVEPEQDWCSLPDIVWASKAKLVDLIDQDLINQTNCFQLHTSSQKHIRGKLAEKLTIW